MNIVRKMPVNILFKKEYINDYDLIIIPCNYMMQPVNIDFINIIKKANINSINKYIIRKYNLSNTNPIKDGDIRITPGFKIKPNLMFVKFPYKSDNISINDFIKVFNDILDKIDINEYKKILLPKMYIAYRCGFSLEESKKIKYIINKALLLKYKNITREIQIQFDEIYCFDQKLVKKQKTVI